MRKTNSVTYDKVSAAIMKGLSRIPRIGSHLSRFYAWKFCTFNFMIVGASGMVLSWLIYEGFLRILLAPYWGGTFWGMLVTTLLIFLWNYFWNRHWSLGINSQIMQMKKGELLELQCRIQALLKQKFNNKGSRIHE